MQELNRQMMALPELRELEEIIRFGTGPAAVSGVSGNSGPLVNRPRRPGFSAPNTYHEPAAANQTIPTVCRRSAKPRAQRR